ARAAPDPATLLGDRVTRGAIRSFLRQPGAARWTFLVMPLLWLGIGAAYGLISPMLVDAGWSLERIGVVTVVVGGAVAIVAALAGGSLIARLGRRRALVVFSGVQVVAIAALLPLSRGSADTAVVLAAVALLNAGYAVTNTAVYTVSMDWSREEVAGSDFTVQSCFAALCSHVVGAVALVVAGAFGYHAVALGSLALAVVGVAAAALLFHDPADRPASSPTARPAAATMAQSGDLGG
ncbi:MAG: MFS transporter, partial [Dermatophilaceae bacterium]